VLQGDVGQVVTPSADLAESAGLDEGADAGADEAALTLDSTALLAAALPPDEAMASIEPAVFDDSLLWRQGQSMEASGPGRDMKGALSNYKQLVADYPESSHYSDSQKRIAFIERFFMGTR
jgi:hypothetical protein